MSTTPPAPLPPNARLRWSVVDAAVRRLAPASILEIGCGQGAFGARLAPRADYLAVEPDPTSYAVARRRIEAAGGRVLNSTDDGVPEGRQVDLLCAFEVLEHLEDDRSALRSWVRHVRPGGHVLVSMPAFQERFNPWDTLVGHYRRYSPDQVRETFTAAGLEPVEVTVYGWPLGYALEGVRGIVAKRKGVGAEHGGPADDMAQRTAGSGRILQPKALVGTAVSAATVPFTWLQRVRPTAGTGVVGLARVPS
ncbi:class I SAM-dependent methyltransferase [Lapillicoccus jejuensis]|uniref:Methyltransferase family protein n=1 Tax=Lapillicoccus jejuensis TaxID=402171 RepID=A0A542DXC7_9MICO|nr:class I SAM-dependent methyltransferase [Lapillicoccus jejuensis]TQJ07574.1 methyltransferase family protein [Lapillicoccus jejuensis]